MSRVFDQACLSEYLGLIRYVSKGYFLTALCCKADSAWRGTSANNDGLETGSFKSTSDVRSLICHCLSDMCSCKNAVPRLNCKSRESKSLYRTRYSFYINFQFLTSTSANKKMG